MSEISLKSITGITSITTPTGVDNQLTVHNNNTTEAVKFDNAGNVHINNQLEVAGVSTFSGGIGSTITVAAGVGSTAITLDNSHQIAFGSANELAMFHDGTNSYIKQRYFSYPSRLKIISENSSIDIMSGSGGGLHGGYENAIQCENNGAVKIYWAWFGPHLETTNGGIIVQGNITLGQDIIHHGDTNTKIRFPAADTITAETAGSERLRIVPTGFVGINSTTPRTNLQVTKGSSHYNPGNPTAFNSNNVLACFENSDDVEVTLLSPNNKKNIINFGDTDNVANSSIEYDHSINHLLFKVNGGSERFRINNSGAFGLAGTNYGTAGQVLTSGGTNGVPTWTTVAAGGASNISFNSGNGIDFSATADGTGSSSRSELLDDYESGEWTGSINSGSANINNPWYVKIGKLVIGGGSITAISDTSSSNSIIVNGLPFSNSGGNSGRGSVTASKNNQFDKMCDCYVSGTTVRFMVSSLSTGSWDYLRHSSVVQSSGSITFAFNYQTA